MKSVKPFSAKLGGLTGLTPYEKRVERRLSDLKNYFQDKQAVKQMLSQGDDPKIYEVYEIPQKPVEGLMNVACTIIYPGKIGSEYYFTKGHFHKKETASEVYIGLKGKGIILIQDQRGETNYFTIEPDVLVYIPPRTAHRSVNVGDVELVFLAIYPSDAGHDYRSIEKRGFAKIVTEKDRKTVLEENPRYISA